jgi:hypothetical protein
VNSSAKTTRFLLQRTAHHQSKLLDSAICLPSDKLDDDDLAQPPIHDLRAPVTVMGAFPVTPPLARALRTHHSLGIDSGDIFLQPQLTTPVSTHLRALPCPNSTSRKSDLHPPTSSPPTLPSVVDDFPTCDDPDRSTPKTPFRILTTTRSPYPDFPPSPSRPRSTSLLCQPRIASAYTQGYSPVPLTGRRRSHSLLPLRPRPLRN